MIGRGFALFFAFVSAAAASERLPLVWPTPNPAYAERKGPEAFIQPTISGRVESGLFGCVRNSGTRFHEALDLKPISRDARGEATDPIYAAMDGVVVYVNTVPSESSYGRYVVIEHREARLPMLTLYAHLGQIREGIQPGTRVKAGTSIGIMGRSARGNHIPRDRAHLHFEIAVWLSEDFQRWYDWKEFGSKNTHGVMNGMNIVGIDPLDFYNQYRSGAVHGFDDYLQAQPTAFVLRVKSNKMPDFIRRYPSLVRGAIPVDGPKGWEIAFTSTGVPKRWQALAAEPDQREQARVVEFDRELVQQCACLHTLNIRGDSAVIGSHTQRTLQLMFGVGSGS